MSVSIGEQLRAIEQSIVVLERLEGDPEIDEAARVRELEVLRAVADTLTDCMLFPDTTPAELTAS